MVVKERRGREILRERSRDIGREKERGRERGFKALTKLKSKWF